MKLDLDELVKQDVINLNYKYSLSNDNLDVLCPAIEKSTVLHTLKLCFNNPTLADGKLAAAIAKNNTLKVLNLLSNDISLEGAKHLADALKDNNTPLEELYLGKNSIGDEGAKYIADMLSDNNTLQTINLSYNKIGDKGALSIAASLTKNTGIQSIDMGWNKIGNQGAEKLVDALESNHNIKHLKLNKINEEVMDRINKALTHNNKDKVVTRVMTPSDNTNTFTNNNGKNSSSIGTKPTPEQYEQTMAAVNAKQSSASSSLTNSGSTSDQKMPASNNKRDTGPPLAVVHITNPTNNDIISGRGAGTQSLEGNVWFRRLVLEKQASYLQIAGSNNSPREKTAQRRKFEEMLMEKVHDYGGRFLTLNERFGIYTLTSEEEALKKIRNLIRKKKTSTRGTDNSSKKTTKVSGSNTNHQAGGRTNTNNQASNELSPIKGKDQKLSLGCQPPQRLDRTSSAATLAANIEMLVAERNTLLERAGSSDAKLKKAKATIQALENGKAETAKELRKDKAQVTTLSRDVEALTTERNESVLALKTCRGEHKKLLKQVDTSKKEIKQLRQEAASSKKKLALVTEEKDRALDDVKKLKDQYQSSMKELALVKQEKEKALKDVTKLKALKKRKANSSTIGQRGKKKQKNGNTNIPQVSWDDIIGNQTAKEALLDLPMCRNPNDHMLYDEEVEEDSNTGVLLYGPPGTGKTLIAKAVANHADCSFTCVSPDTVLNQFIGKSEERMREIFNTAKAEAVKHKNTSVLFFDECDRLFRKPGKNDCEVSSTITGIFQICMEGVQQPKGKVVVLAATNHPEKIPQEILSRFQNKIKVQLPDSQARIAITKLQIEKQTVSIRSDMKEADFTRLAEVTEGASGRDIKTLVKNALVVRRTLTKNHDGWWCKDEEDCYVPCFHSCTKKCKAEKFSYDQRPNGYIARPPPLSYRHFEEAIEKYGLSPQEEDE